MTVFGGKMAPRKKLPVVTEGSPPKKEVIPESAPAPYKVEAGPFGTTDADPVSRIRTHFLRILSGYLPRHRWTRLHEGKWKFTTLAVEFRKGYGYLTFHAEAQYYVHGPHLEQLIEQLRKTEGWDRMSKRMTVLYIVREQACKPGRKWRRFGMWDGSEEMLALCTEIPDGGEGVVVLLRPEDRRAILAAWQEFKTTIDI